MTRAVLLLLLAWAAAAEDYRLALPGYQYEFPRDHFNHPEFQTEWWYYTGNLRSGDGRRFGFELTFFRLAIARDNAAGSPWRLDDLYVAHLALSDIKSGEFHHEERVNRAGPGLAGASFEQRRIWNGNWQVVWAGEPWALRAVTEKYTLELKLVPQKLPVIHGIGGISRKAEGEGNASHYISFTHLEASGELVLDGRRHVLNGTAWMDHEFFTHQLAEDQTGWDWMSIQLDDGSDLMLFQLRRNNRDIDPYSAGTYIDASGRKSHLTADDFTMTPRDAWESPVTRAVYPIRWTVNVPSLGLKLEATTPMANQELAGKSRFSPTYWEGAMDFQGTAKGEPVRGAGYLEMTGYDRPVNLGQRDAR